MRRVTGLLAAVLVAGCGVPAQDEPHAVELPRRPLATAAATPRPGSYAEILCLVKNGGLVQAVRRIDAVPGPADQLAHLAAGPTAVERNAGLSTALSGLSLQLAGPGRAGAVQVAVTEPADGGARSDETLAYGQVVCTLTSRPDVDAVVFTQDGERLDVPRADGSLTAGPLTAEDYAALIVPS